ncbi:hypothetical protein F66182_5717 [Fusarium sp. NRRL 66182]|nr:hypothetical protein F66182_5717 [Fusarium sp. NRRL 66182]
MSISKLPPSTAHLLRSSSAIADPLSLVKELVDNSIDAGATSIEITIAPNTVDKIQVRDNGRGIQLDDYGFLGRRSYTSKLRNFKELRLKGSQTLGFRGEALASANCLATIKITTRTAQDPVASLLLLKSGSGGIAKQQPVSGAVGTTVQALNLFQNIPVRKENAVKGSKKALANIKQLLDSYALALPHLKLSFRVPGDSYQPWLYTPRSSSTTREAITQVFGHTFVTQLIEVSTTNNDGSSTTEESQGMVLTAFLPRPGCDTKVIKGNGAFISVDSRPLSSLRGTGKKLVAIFKSSISGVLGSPETSRAPSNPFMRLSISCEPGSYDPNVSPLKDEVLFRDEPTLLSCFQDLCNSVYKVSASKGPKHKLIPTESPVSPVTGASRNSVSKPKEGPCQVNFEDECFLDDQELIESLNEEFIGVLGESPRAFSDGQVLSSHPSSSSTSPKNTLQPTNQHETKGVSKIQTVEKMMRTKSVVNLSRKGSDSTDVDGMEGLVPVRVAPRRAATPPKDQLKSPFRRQAPTPRRHFEDIGHYFRPVRDEPIEIATDETATPGNSQNEQSKLCSRGTHRLPLKELTGADLNTSREEDDEEEVDEESVVNLDGVVPSFRPSPRASPRRAVPSRPLNNPFRLLTRPRQVPNSDFQQERLLDLQSPPSSDPTRTQDSPRQNSRGQSFNTSFGRGQGRSRGSTVPSAQRVAGQGLIQSRLLIGSGPTASQNRRRPEQVWHGNGLVNGGNTLTTNRDDTDALFKDSLHNGRAGSEDEEG